MGSTYVRVGPAENDNPGFWIDDSSLEIWLFLMALNMEWPGPEDNDRNRLLREMRDQWLMASRIGMNGCVPHGFEGFTANPIGMQIVRDTVSEISNVLETYAEDFPKDAFKFTGWPSARYWTHDVSNHRLKEIAKSFREVLNARF